MTAELPEKVICTLSGFISYHSDCIALAEPSGVRLSCAGIKLISKGENKDMKAEEFSIGNILSNQKASVYS